MAEAERPSSPSPLLSPRFVPPTVKLDFDTFEKNLLGECRKELRWPAQDVTVSVVPKKPRSEPLSRTFPTVTTNTLSHSIKVTQQGLVQTNLYTKSGDTQVPPTAFYSEFATKEYEVDVPSPTSVKNVIGDLGAPKDLDEMAEKRSSNCNIFRLLFHPAPLKVPDLSKVPSDACIKPVVCDELEVTVNKLAFTLGDYQPFFITLTLYDLATQKKISADFHTHVNSQEVLKLMGGQAPGAAVQTVVFRLPQGFNHDSVYLVAFVEKVLSEDADHFVDWYSKEKIKDKEKTKWIAEIQDTVKRLSEFRQIAAWSAVQLFSGGKMVNSGACNMSLFRMNKTRDLWQYLDEVKTQKAKIKHNFGTLSCKIQLYPAGSYKGDKMDHMLCKVLPFSGKTSVAREVPLYPIHYPLNIQTEYNNCIFINPGNCTISRAPSIKAKNLMIEFKLMASDVSPKDPGLETIFGDLKSDFVSEKSTCVWFNDKKPTFMDEIKILLPPQLTPKHHVLITYYNVQVKAGKKSDTNPVLKTPVAYSFLPLFTDRILDTSQPIDLGIVKDLTPNYLSQDPETIPWLEKKKATLTLNVTLDSSLYPRDTNLSAFLCSEATQAKVLLQDSDPKEVIRFLPQVIYLLSKLLSEEVKCGTPRKPSNRLSTITPLASAPATSSNSGLASAVDVEPPSTFADLVWTISVIEENHNDHLLDSYIQNLFDNDDLPDLWIVLVKSWHSALSSQDPAAYDSVRYARFLFAFILKGLTLAIHKAGLFDKDGKNRPKRISVDQKRHLFLLCSEITRNVLKYFCIAGMDKELGRMLNTVFAHFVSDLYTLLDRGLVSELVYKILEDIDTPLFEGDKSSQDCLTLKLHFFHVLAQSPLFTHLTCPMVEAQFDFVHTVPKNWTETHFLTGTLAGIVADCLKSPNNDIIVMAFNTLAAIFYWIDHDVRFTSGVRCLIGDCYFPVLVAVIDQWEKLRMLAGPQHGFGGMTPLDKEATKLMYGCIAWILQGTGHQYLQVWWEKETERRIRNFFGMLQTLTAKFLYKDHRVAVATRSGDLYHLLSEKFSEIPQLLPRETPGRAITVVTEVDPKQKKKKGAVEAPTIKMVVDPVISSYLASVKANIPKHKLDSEKQHDLEMLLISETNLIVLNTCVAFISKFRNLLGSKLELFEDSFRTINNILHYPQSVDVYSAVLHTLHSLLPEFQSIFFLIKNEVFGEIVYEIIHCFNSKIQQTRSEAMALYLHIIDANLQEAKQFARTKLQTTIATTKLVGQENAIEQDITTINDFKILRDTFATVAGWFSNSTLECHFGIPISEQMASLQQKIDNIVEGYVKMQEYRYDPEMMAHLYENISCQLLDSPDERITWLENLSSFHANKGNLEESAQTKVITAAVIQEYLTLIHRWHTKLPAAFDVVCPNTADMLQLPDKKTKTALRSLATEICQSRLFNHEGFVGLLKEAIEMLKTGGYYESAVEAYRMMLPIYQESADYARQNECYRDLVQLTDTLTDAIQMQQRIFSNYYRVTFYSKNLLKDLDEKTFVYKEKNTVMLPVFAQNIMAQYSKKFGAENVVSLPNKSVKVEELDPNKLYIQLGAVHPFFEDGELEERNTEWKRVYNLKSFYMDQPFTKGDKVHAESAADQWIRRYIYTCKFAFPHLQKRIEVVSTREQELAPIENATNAILDKTQNLKSELNMTSPRLKILQIHLQGVLLIQVNAGPMALVEIFLSEKVADKYSLDVRNKLADAFTDFVRALQLSVSLNAQLIGPDQKQLQETLEEQLDLMKKKLAEYPIFEQRKEQLERERQELLREQRKRAAQTLSEVESTQPSAPLAAVSRSRIATASKDNRRSVIGLSFPPQGSSPSTSSNSLGSPSRSDRRKSAALGDSPVSTPSVKRKGTGSRSKPKSSEREQAEKVFDKESPKREKSKQKSLSRSTSETRDTENSEKSTSRKNRGSTESEQKIPTLATSMSEREPTRDHVRPTLPHADTAPVLPTLHEIHHGAGARTGSGSGASSTGAGSGVGGGQDDKVARARQAIMQLSGEIRGSLRSMEMLIPTILSLEEGLGQVKMVRATNESLKGMGTIVNFGDYSYAPPPQTTDKMATIKYILQKEIDVGTNLLKELEAKLPMVSETPQLIVLLKVIKDSHEKMKS